MFPLSLYSIDLVVLPATREMNGKFYQWDGTTLPW